MTTPSPQQAAEVAAAIEAQAQVRQAVTQQGVAGVLNLIRGFTDWWNTRAITDLVNQITGILQPRQEFIAANTDAYLAHTLSVLQDRVVQPVGPIRVADLRTGTTMPDVYGRLADNYRYLVSDAGGNTPEPDALDQILNRGDVMAQTDMDLAMRDQAGKFMLARNVTGYRRVIRPELSRTGTCGLCIVASDRVYHKAELMPLHARCKCEVVPIINGKDVGGHLNGEDLTRLYGDAGSNRRDDLKKVRYTVHQNGQLGPVLTASGEAFRTPADVKAATAA